MTVAPPGSLSPAITLVVVLVDDHDFAPGLARAITAAAGDLFVAHARDLDALALHLRAVLPDLVVTDLRLPGVVSPADCLGAVRALWPGPLAALTGDDTDEARSACVTRAAAHWIKPLDVAELVDRCRARIAEYALRKLT